MVGGKDYLWRVMERGGRGGAGGHHIHLCVLSSFFFKYCFSFLFFSFLLKPAAHNELISQTKYTLWISPLAPCALRGVLPLFPSWPFLFFFPLNFLSPFNSLRKRNQNAHPQFSLVFFAAIRVFFFFQIYLFKNK